MDGKRPLARRIFHGLAKLAILGLLGIALLFGSLWIEHAFPITLPAPTGPFPVGRSIYDWTDQSSVDTLAPVSGTKRELLVSIWYPAVKQSTATADYFPAGWRAA